jgi:hypothetical protein
MVSLDGGHDWIAFQLHSNSNKVFGLSRRCSHGECRIGFHLNYIIGP